MKNFLIFTFFVFFVCSTSYGQRILLSQGFENGPWTADSLPQKWAKVKVIASTCTTGPVADWRARDSGEVFCGTNSITGYLSKAFNTKRGLSIPWTSGNGNNTDDWVFTDSLRIATGDSLIFWSQLGTWPGGTATYYLDSLQVWVTSAQTPASQIARLGTVRSLAAASNVWQEIKYNLSAYNGQKVYVAFRYFMNTSVDGIMVNIDSVMVRNLTATPPVGTCNYSWATQTSGTTSLLYSVSAVSDQIGWAAGAAATVRRTTDGGTTWGNGNPNPGVIAGDIYNIYAWSANDALVTTSSSSATFLYRTTNGGTNWTQVFTQTGGFLDGIQMISTTEGYALGDPVGGKWTVIKTVDGGATWARMATEPVQAGTEAGYNNSFYILGNNIWFGSGNTRVYHSTDLGLTWSFGATTGTANSFAVHYNTALNGMVGGSAMVKSVDGGTTYTSATAPGASGSLDGIEGNGTDWWAIRTGTDVYRSTNQGSTWTTANTVAGAAFNDIDFTTPVGGCPSGWVVGTGTIVKMTGLLVGISSNYSGEIPTSYLLKQNYPNPFNPTTNISFSIPKSSFVSIKVYDLVGKEVANLVNETKSAGNYIVGFNAGNLPSGTYFYRIESDNFIDTKKMILVK